MKVIVGLADMERANRLASSISNNMPVNHGKYVEFKAVETIEIPSIWGAKKDSYLMTAKNFLEKLKFLFSSRSDYDYYDTYAGYRPTEISTGLTVLTEGEGALAICSTPGHPELFVTNQVSICNGVTEVKLNVYNLSNQDVVVKFGEVIACGMCLGSKENIELDTVEVEKYLNEKTAFPKLLINKESEVHNE